MINNNFESNSNMTSSTLSFSTRA